MTGVKQIWELCVDVGSAVYAIRATVVCCLICRKETGGFIKNHYNDVTMGSIAAQIASLTIVYPTVYSGADQRKHQSSASLAFVTLKMFPFDDGIMITMYPTGLPRLRSDLIGTVNEGDG